jgi:nitroimidazol reductase NimA-like FMN-containing flavoprotein (pyridoxamine 5'-phosphate oxidase superfamily)
MTTPSPELDSRYSDPEAAATSWEDATAILGAAALSWISTVRPDGRPHVTPLITVMHEGTVHFCTGPEERKARNIASNPALVLTTGRNALHGGTDVVLEGRAERVTGEQTIRALADAWVAKYGEEWRFEVTPDAFRHPGGEGEAWVYAVRASAAYGFGKDPYSQTRWSFTS